MLTNYLCMDAGVLALGLLLAVYIGHSSLASAIYVFVDFLTTT